MRDCLMALKHRVTKLIPLLQSQHNSSNDTPVIAIYEMPTIMEYMELDIPSKTFGCLSTYTQTHN